MLDLCHVPLPRSFSPTAARSKSKASGRVIIFKPHRVKTFKLSRDPRLPEKPTRPGWPLKKGRGGTMTHDYKRNGTTTLFAALELLPGKVIGQCHERH
jgi:hypothetical protein